MNLIIPENVKCLAVPYTQIYFTLLNKIYNPVFWETVKQIAGYVPGGYYYEKAEQGIKYDPQQQDYYYKVMQYYLNANRFEFALLHVFNTLVWSDATHATFHPGFGTSNADFYHKENNLGFDAKIYLTWSSFNTEVITNIKNNKTSKLFHNGSFLLAYINETKTLYQVRRPYKNDKFDENDIFWIKPLTGYFVPNVLINENGNYIIDKNNKFELLRFKADPINTVDCFYFD